MWQASPRKHTRAIMASAKKTKMAGVSPRFGPSSVLGWAGGNIVLAGARYPVIYKKDNIQCNIIIWYLVVWLQSTLSSLGQVPSYYIAYYYFLFLFFVLAGEKYLGWSAVDIVLVGDRYPVIILYVIFFFFLYSLVPVTQLLYCILSFFNIFFFVLAGAPDTQPLYYILSL